MRWVNGESGEDGPFTHFTTRGERGSLPAMHNGRFAGLFNNVGQIHFQRVSYAEHRFQRRPFQPPLHVADRLLR